MINDWELGECKRFVKHHPVMSNVQLSENKDKMVWKLKKHGMFTVKSFYTHLMKRGGDCQFSGPTNVESEDTSKNCFFFSQEAGWKCILMIDKMTRMGKIMVNGCYLCMKAAESCNHILL